MSTDDAEIKVARMAYAALTVVYWGRGDGVTILLLRTTTVPALMVMSAAYMVAPSAYHSTSMMGIPV